MDPDQTGVIARQAHRERPSPRRSIPSPISARAPGGGGHSEPRVFENLPKNAFDKGIDSEEVAWSKLSAEGYDIDDIEALYTERSPCPEYCTPLFQKIGLPESIVFWSFNSNAPFAVRSQYAAYISRVVNQLRWSQ